MNILQYINSFKIIAGIAMLVTVTFTSCEKEIAVDLPDYQSKVVIEGSIEPGKPAMVFVTRSTDYFQKYDQETITNMFVNNAFITVTNQSGVIDSLHYAIDPTQAMPFLYIGTHVLGEVGGTYQLKVVVDGKEYQSTTTILPSVPIDSLTFVEENMEEHLGIVRASFTDPAGIHNYYRVFAKVLGTDQIFLPTWGGATFDDRLIDGIHTFSDIYRGGRSNLLQDTASGGNRMKSHFFSPGDTVVIKWCSLDYNSYRFWSSADVEINSGGNPFTSPAPIVSNIPNALGVWCGYGTRFDTIVISQGAKRR